MMGITVRPAEIGDIPAGTKARGMFIVTGMVAPAEHVRAEAGRLAGARAVTGGARWDGSYHDPQIIVAPVVVYWRKKTRGPFRKIRAWAIEVEAHWLGCRTVAMEARLSLAGTWKRMGD